mmetsp:Transcript_19613/g.55770  ORF Transcript_19613/g.55770 Transcript_19613/m.55770 type:complete len:272 (+) Transcript_19613:222-1037(+)
MRCSLKRPRSRLQSEHRCRDANGKPSFCKKACIGSYNSGGALDTNSKLARYFRAHILYNSGIPTTARKGRTKVFWRMRSGPRKTSVTFTVSSMSEIMVMPRSSTRGTSVLVGAIAVTPAVRSARSETTRALDIDRDDGANLTSIFTAGLPNTGRAKRATPSSEKERLVSTRPSLSVGGNSLHMESRVPAGASASLASSRHPPRSCSLKSSKFLTTSQMRSSTTLRASASRSLMRNKAWRTSRAMTKRRLCRSSRLRNNCATNRTLHPPPSR